MIADPSSERARLERDVGRPERDGPGAAEPDFAALGVEPLPRAPDVVGVAVLRSQPGEASDDGVGRAVAEAGRAERAVERAVDPHHPVEQPVAREPFDERAGRPHGADGVRTRGSDADREEIEG